MSFAELVTGIDRATHQHLGGEAVVYRPEFGDEVTVTGMFEENFQLFDRDGGAVENVGPAFTALLSDLPQHPEDDEPTLVIRGTEYKVRERQTDGSQGALVTLLLHKGM
jgi:hypothetical protein